MMPSTSNGNVAENQASINDIDDYSLAQIFNYLPFIDRVRDERVCKHWRDISRQHGSLYSKKLTIGLDTGEFPYANKSFRENEDMLEKILEYHGQYLEDMDFNYECRHTLSERAVTVLAKYCPKLKRLDATYLTITKDNLMQLAEDCPNLEEVVFGRRLSLTENHLSKFLSKTKQLKRFSISYKMFISGVCLLSLSPGQLDSLWVEDCTFFHLTREIAEHLAPSLVQFCYFGENKQNLENISCLTNLRRLLIRTSDRLLTNSRLQEIISSCRLLEAVDLGRSLSRRLNHDITSILELPNLKELTIMGQMPISEPVLMAKTFDKIERLTLGCSNMKHEETYRNLAIAYPALKHLSICACNLDRVLPWVTNPQQFLDRNVIIKSHSHHSIEFCTRTVHDEVLIFRYAISPVFTQPRTNDIVNYSNS